MGVRSEGGGVQGIGVGGGGRGAEVEVALRAAYSMVSLITLLVCFRVLYSVLWREGERWRCGWG